MLLFIFGVALGLMTVASAVLFSTYSKVPLREYKRRARSGDKIAALLYRPVSYGIGARLILAIFGLICLYFSFVLLTESVGEWLAVPVLLVLGLFGLFFVRSRGGLHPASVWLAAKISPPLGWVLERLNPIFAWLERLVRRIRPIRIHSGLYEKDDLVRLLDNQSKQADNRIPKGEISLLKHALQFGDKRVADVLVPRRVVVAVSASESVGPVTMGELHASGHSRFPVYDGAASNIIGILYMHDMVGAKQGGIVRDIMQKQVMYVNENFDLYQTLQAFLKTKKHLFIVVNDFEEYVGIVTIEDVLERVIGKLIVDEFDRYDDLRAVAASTAKHEREIKKEAGKAAEDHADAADVPEPDEANLSSESNKVDLKAQPKKPSDESSKQK